MSRPLHQAQSSLLRGLEPLAGPFEVVDAQSRPWWSATFDGARHRLTLRLGGAEAEAQVARLAAGLAEEEIALRGAFVADIRITAPPDAGPLLAIEALTIEDVRDPPAFSRGAPPAG